MDRRDRDNRGGRRNDQGPRGAKPQGHPNPLPRRGPPAQAAPRLPSYEDPNAYRSPGFQDISHNPYKIDYAGLPKDDEDPDGVNAQPQPGNARAGFHPRGMNGRRPDRAGTDPNAYRSPGFQNERRGSRSGVAPKLPQADVAEELGESSQQMIARAESPMRDRAPGSPSRRERRAQRPRFETTCQACGAAATVPFEPGPDRPAFCKPCYESKREEMGLGPGKRPQTTPRT